MTMLDSVLRHFYSMPMIGEHDVYVFEPDEILEDKNGEPLRVGDTVIVDNGEKLVVEYFIDVVAMGTYFISDEGALYFLTEAEKYDNS